VIRVLIVDDSAFICKTMAQELSRYADIEVVGTARDPYGAREQIVQLKPDVLTLDVEMPRMDGLSFLAKLMKHYPIPVVMVSSLTPKNSEAALRAFELGAVEVIAKPGSQFSMPDVAGQLVRAIRAASVAQLKKATTSTNPAFAGPPIAMPVFETSHKVLAIGASTGGTQAIEAVLTKLPATTPGTVITQHMPEFFTAAFADRLNKICAMEVREARDADNVVPGVALIAPGNKHMVLQRSGATYLVRIKDGPPVHHQRPSVDVMFLSVARSAGKNATGVILTGMGADGAKGLLSMRESGAKTIAQDQETCVVFGMPKEAIKLGAAEQIVPLSRIPQAILQSFATTIHVHAS
jgi:two-component system, chemotaxis family, protein-glutamate methylesterase/glutaminase